MPLLDEQRIFVEVRRVFKANHCVHRYYAPGGQFRVLTIPLLTMCDPTPGSMSLRLRLVPMYATAHVLLKIPSVK